LAVVLSADVKERNDRNIFQSYFIVLNVNINTHTSRKVHYTSSQ